MNKVKIEELLEYKYFHFIKDRIDRICISNPYTKNKQNLHEFENRISDLFSNLESIYGFTRSNWMSVVGYLSEKQPKSANYAKLHIINALDKGLIPTPKK